MENKLFIKIRTKEQLEAAACGVADALICPPALIGELQNLFEYNDTSEILKDDPPAGQKLSDNAVFAVERDELQKSGNKEEVYISLPQILREKQADRIERELGKILENYGDVITGFLIENIDSAGLLRKIGYEGKVIGGELFYSYNSRSIEFAKNLFPQIILISPPELTSDEIRRVESASKTEFIYKIYGHQALMITEQCFFKNYQKCLLECKYAEQKNNSGIKPTSKRTTINIEKAEDMKNDLTGRCLIPSDRKSETACASEISAGRKEQFSKAMGFINEKNEKYFAVTDCENCFNIVYSGRPTYMLDKLDEISNRPVLLEFTLEDSLQTEAILNNISKPWLSSGKPTGSTRGHFYKPVD